MSISKTHVDQQGPGWASVSQTTMLAGLFRPPKKQTSHVLLLAQGRREIRDVLDYLHELVPDPTFHIRLEWTVLGSELEFAQAKLIPHLLMLKEYKLSQLSIAIHVANFMDNIPQAAVEYMETRKEYDFCLGICPLPQLVSDVATHLLRSGRIRVIATSPQLRSKVKQAVQQSPHVNRFGF
ncbi:hypothetical protein BASA81_009083 [Batrachochytrium salamandrivorans]|nr:hypothetical protein BASA81_009083 [Batrachochytrium salamandrivorans]